MKIGLLTTLDHNIGDDFIREGLLAVIRSCPPAGPLELVPVNKHLPHTIYSRWHPMRLAVAKIDAMKRKVRARALSRRFLQPLGPSRFDDCDLIIQCGTPILWRQCHLSEWAEPVWRDVLSRLGGRIPVLNLGGGSCYPWQSQPSTLIGDQDEQFARLMLSTASLTTVRDALAAQLLGSLGQPAPEVIPCPAMLAGQAFTSPIAPRRRVLVNYMHGGAHTVWGQPIDPNQWEATMSSVVAKVRRDWEVTVVCHNQPEAGLAARLWPDLPRVLPRNPAEYFAIARDAALGIVNRLHAAVALSGLGIPSVSIGTDTRMLMPRTVGLPVHYVGTVTAEAILSDFERLAASRPAESERLLSLRKNAFDRYQQLLGPWVARVQRKE